MGRVFEATLSTKSINKLIKDLETYKRSLDNKLNVFISRLVHEVGIPVIDERFASARGDSSSEHDTEFVIDSSDNGVVGTLYVSGKDMLFIEFGAGIKYNNGNANPKASELGMGVGTYPGQTHAINPGYWWYKGEDDAMHLSYGTEATMPVYTAGQEMRQAVLRIAKEVFGND